MKKTVALVMLAVVLSALLTGCSFDKRLYEYKLDIYGTEYTLMLPKKTQLEFDNFKLTINITVKGSVTVDLQPLVDCTDIETVELIAQKADMTIDVPSLPRLDYLNVDCAKVVQFTYLTPNTNEDIIFTGTVENYDSSTPPKSLTFTSQKDFEGVFRLTDFYTLSLSVPCDLSVFDEKDVFELSLNGDGWDLTTAKDIKLKHLLMYPESKAELTGIADLSLLQSLCISGPVDISELEGSGIYELHFWEAQASGLEYLNMLDNLFYIELWMNLPLEVLQEGTITDEQGKVTDVSLFASKENAYGFESFIAAGGTYSIACVG